MVVILPKTFTSAFLTPSTSLKVMSLFFMTTVMGVRMVSSVILMKSVR